MKLLHLISLGFCLMLATPRANANAEPEPMVATKIEQTCNETMVNATSHNVLCKKAADHIVEKIGKVCRKAVKYGCTLTSFAVDYNSCFAKMTGLICPNSIQETMPKLELSTPQPVTKEIATSTKPPPKASKVDVPSAADHPSLVGRFIMSQCDQRLQGITSKMPAKSNEPFNSTIFCKELGKSGQETCLVTLVGTCENLPKDWVKVRDICKNYVIPWICK